MLQAGDREASRSMTRAGVRALLAGRLAIVSFFMGIVVFYKVKYGQPGQFVPAMEPVVAAYLLTIIYTICFRFVSDARRFANIQLYLDMLLVTWILHYTGGLNSPFSFMYILIIIASAFFREERGSFIPATICSVLYLSLLGLEFLGLISPYYAFPPIGDSHNLYYVGMTGSAHVITFYFIAFMSDYFMGMVSQTGQELVKKSEDFTLLKAFHENVLDSMALGFMAIGLDGAILSHNPASRRILRIGEEDINRKQADTVLKLPDLSGFFGAFLKTKDHFRQFDWTHRSGEKEDVEISMTISKFETNGTSHGFIAVFQDMTKLKRMERNLASSERLAAIGRITAGIAHEIRNPLASLSGSMQILQSDLAPVINSQSARLMEIMVRETDRLNRIITQFLSYAAMPHFKPSRVDTCKLVSEMLDLLKSDPKSMESIRLIQDCSAGLIASVDQEQVKQVLWNLCKNGLDAMPEGGELAIMACMDETFHDESARRFVRISIKDTGVGIPGESIDKIFEPFYTTKTHGTGLGLPTALKIVKTHGGHMKVHSAQGEGTVFTIWLPVDNEADMGQSKKIEHGNAEPLQT